MRTVVTSLSRACLAAAAACLLTVPARASGPVERMLQSLAHPTDANVIIVRYGVPTGPSNGFVFSSDGGKTFKAGCSSMIAPSLRLQRSSSAYLSTAVLTGDGKIAVSQNKNEFFVGDGTGCGYDKEPGFENKTGAGIALDPADPKALYALVYTNDPATPDEIVTEVMRRDAAGTWSTVGPVKPPAAKQKVYGSDILVAALETGGPRVVTLYSTLVGTVTNYAVGISEDGGKTFTEHPVADPGDAYFVRLVALDPTNPDRVLALRYGDSLKDELLLSSDKGATFKPWAEVDGFSGATFAPDGRVFISDAADGIEGSRGGLFTAAKLGDPLLPLGEPRGVDCVQYRALDQKLFACQGDRFGTVDPETGTFAQLMRIGTVSDLLDCPGKDVSAICKDQLNSGSSWCCVGHSPCTPFCSQYNITSVNGKPVLCGMAGRAADESNGKMCGGDGTEDDAGAAVGGDAGAAARDAGTAKMDAGTTIKKDAGKTGDDDDDDDDQASPAKGSDDGCSIKAPGSSTESAGITLASLGLLLLTMGRVLRRRHRC